MERFGYTEEMLFDRVINEPFLKLMQFEIARAEALYEFAAREYPCCPGTAV